MVEKNLRVTRIGVIALLIAGSAAAWLSQTASGSGSTMAGGSPAAR